MFDASSAPDLAIDQQQSSRAIEVLSKAVSATSLWEAQPIGLAPRFRARQTVHRGMIGNAREYRVVLEYFDLITAHR